MVFPILVRRHLYIESGPWCIFDGMYSISSSTYLYTSVLDCSMYYCPCMWYCFLGRSRWHNHPHTHMWPWRWLVLHSELSHWQVAFHTSHVVPLAQGKKALKKNTHPRIRSVFSDILIELTRFTRTIYISWFTWHVLYKIGIIYLIMGDHLFWESNILAGCFK